MVIIKQDKTQFVFLKGNAFLLKGRIIIVLNYQSRKPASLLEPPKLLLRPNSSWFILIRAV